MGFLSTRLFRSACPRLLGRWALCLCLCGCLCGWPLAAWAQPVAHVSPWKPPVFSHFLQQNTTEQTGLSALNGITAIAQDATGYMWFGAETGLVRFNGAQFEAVNALASDPTRLSSNGIHGLLLDHKKVLWVATDTGLNRYHDATDQFSQLLVPNTLPAQTALST